MDPVVAETLAQALADSRASEVESRRMMRVFLEETRAERRRYFEAQRARLEQQGVTLRAETPEMRTELRQEIKDTADTLRAEMQQMGRDLHEEIEKVRDTLRLDINKALETPRG